MPKITKAYLKTAVDAYIYPDGHAVLCHAEHAINAKWVTIHEKAFNVVGNKHDGRVLVSSPPEIMMVTKAVSISWTRQDKRWYTLVDFGAGPVWFAEGPLAVHPECSGATFGQDYALYREFREWAGLPITKVIMAS